MAATTRSLVTIHTLLISAVCAFSQGNLTPPGAPAPTMKTLDQLEPRTPINNTTTPGDASYHHIITQPGSYYLTGNLAVTKANGIDVRAQGVTIDLGGFEVNRSSGSGGHGIEVDLTAHRCVIQNGKLVGFAYGLRCINTASDFPRAGRCSRVTAAYCTTIGLQGGHSWVIESCTAHDNTGPGISANEGSTISHCSATANSGLSAAIFAGTGCSVLNCAALDNDATGIQAGVGCTLINCSASGNTGTHGIFASSGSTLEGCSAYGNTAGYGIATGAGASLKNCTSRFNTSGGNTTGGISVDSGSSVIGCTASNNISTNATPTGSTGLGIRVVSGCTVRDCTTESNRGDGIQVVGDRCQIVGNTCSGNTTGGVGGGIHLTSGVNGARVEGNHCAGNVRNFFIEGTDNLVVRNSAQGASVTNYDIVADNHDAARTTSPGAGFASTSPWVNFSF